MGTKVSLWTVNNGEIPANLAFTNNFTATAAPGVDNDKSVGQGYRIGSVWIYAGVWYVCTDDTIGAAVWSTGNGGTTAGQITAPAGSTATAVGGTAKLAGGAGGTTSGAGGPSQLTGGAGGGTGNGGVAQVTGGSSGAGATGAGGSVVQTGGAAASTNGNGGSVIRRGGAKAGAGVNGSYFTNYPAPAAKTVSATLTPAEVLGGMLTVNQGGAAGSTLTMPLGTDLEAAMPAEVAVGDCFDFTIMNISAVAAEVATLAQNTGVTLVGNVTIAANSAITTISDATFRCRRTAASTFVVYRIS